MNPLSRILNSINKKVEIIDRQDIDIDYTPYIVNRGMSYFYDTILFANEMNMYSDTPKYLQYMFYYNALGKKGRFSTWHKKSKMANLDIVKEYFDYSDTKAEEALELLTDEHIESIKQLLYKGGLRR